ncbi:ATP-binding protein [Thalassotalea psychrophila]|uniref:ATP-binding protein n=1 Tax=Thalassotalea psychrophila TaxID=3065647 RepID=A0ABY9TZT9_9GAMM|nr:ATP-binding protein [Colwelliaceae bacterium SQ149]
MLKRHLPLYDGIGIKKEDRDRVINAYQRGANDSDLGNSYGLGVAFASVISEWHKGELQINSSATLGGTKVILILPNQAN